MGQSRGQSDIEVGEQGNTGTGQLANSTHHHRMAAILQAEEVAAALHESFLKGGLQPEAFTEQYSKQRTAFHILALKREASRFAQF